MRPRDLFLALLPPILWATGYSVGKGALPHFQPLFTTALMYAIAGVILFRPRDAIKPPLRWLIIISVFGCGLQSALIFYGVWLVDTSLANLVVQAQVPSAILAAWLLGLDRLNPLRMTGGGVAGRGVFRVGLSDMVWPAGAKPDGSGRAFCLAHALDRHVQRRGVLRRDAVICFMSSEADQQVLTTAQYSRKSVQGSGSISPGLNTRIVCWFKTPLCQGSCPPLYFSSISQVGGIGR